MMYGCDVNIGNRDSFIEDVSSSCSVGFLEWDCTVKIKILI